jgi:hypothetical protein
MPSFQPIPQSELKRNRLMDKGTYDFEVVKAENKTFGTGSNGIALTVAVFGPSGGQKWIDCNLVFVPKAMFQVADFCATTGLMGHYELGNLDAQDCLGRGGKCRVGIEEKEGYEPRNKITGFVAPKAANAGAAPRQAQSARVATDTQRPATTTAANSDALDKDTLPF